MTVSARIRRLGFLTWFGLLLAGAARADFPHSSNMGGLDLTPLVGNQLSPSMIPDGSGGFLVAWNEDRDGYYYSWDIYAQRVDAFGHPLWAPNGVPVCIQPGGQNLPAAVSDGTGGVVLLWRDDRPGGEGYWAQRLNALGVPQWAVNGIKVLTQTHTDYTHRAVTDGAGGIWFVATRDSSGTSSLTLQHVTASGALPAGSNGILVRTQSSRSLQGVLAPDGTGGVYVGWSNYVAGSYSSTYLQRYSAAGVPQWNPLGLAALSWPGGGVTTEFTGPLLQPDGEGGCLVAARIGTFGAASGISVYAQRVGPSGASLWNIPGVSVVNNTAFNDWLQLAPDGLGGALVSWRDSRFGSGEAVAQHFSNLGTAQWSAGGLHLPPSVPGAQMPLAIVPDTRGGGVFLSLGGGAISAARVTPAGAVTQSAVTMTTGNAESRMAAAPDADGGVFVTWDANGFPNYYDIYAGHLDRYGLVGSNGPRLTSVRDVALDQGGRVKVSWDSAWLDNDSDLGVYAYRVWRSVPAGAPGTLVRARPVTRDADEAAANGWLLADAANSAIGWELVGTQPAALLPSYSFVAPTAADSVAAGVPWTAFRVEAISGTAIDARHWWSVVDSAYSVDDLPPAAPASFSGVFGAGRAILQWTPNTEGDLSGYRLYRGATSNFTPGPVTLVGEPTQASYVDDAAHPYVYKLTAVDVHGNESVAATLAPPGVTAVENGSTSLAFASPSPSPARGTTTLRWTLPVAARVRVSLHDVAGRYVRTWADEELAAGTHERNVECVDGEGRSLAAGVYVVTLEALGKVSARKLLVVR